MSSIDDIEVRAQEYKSLLDDGDLSQEEFDELIEDLLDETLIEDDINFENNKIRLEKAIDAVKIIAGLIS
jgi:polyhydroxyalkanoate synthesis regulator phasin